MRLCPSVVVVVPADDVRDVEVRVAGIKVFVELSSKIVLFLGVDVQYEVWAPEFCWSLDGADGTPKRIHRCLRRVVKEIQVHVLTLDRCLAAYTGFG